MRRRLLSLYHLPGVTIFGLALTLVLGGACTIHEGDSLPSFQYEPHYTGCSAVYADGSCELPESRQLTLWLPKSEFPLKLLSNAQELSSEPTPSENGIRHVIVVPEGAKEVTVVRSDQGSTLWRLTLRPPVAKPPIVSEATSLRRAGKLDEALALLSTYPATESAQNRAQVTGLEARIHRGSGNLDAAMAHYREAISLYEEADNLSGKIRDVISLAYILIENRIDLEEAARLLATVANELPLHSHSIFRVTYHQGLLAGYKGDHRRAAQYLRQALQEAKRMGHARFRSYANQVLSLSLETTGQVDQALNTLREELNEMPEEGAACDKLFLLNNYAWMGLLALESDKTSAQVNIDELTSLLDSALLVAKKECGEFPDQEINAYLNLALCHLQRDDYASAKRVLKTARTIQTRFAHPYLELWALDGEARIAAQDNNLDQALAHYKAMHTSAVRAADPSGRWRALAGQATTLDSMGRLDEAQTTYAKAESLLNQDSLLIPLHGGRDAFLSKRGFVTQRYVESLLSLKKVDQALQVVRHARSRYLRELQMADLIGQLAGKEKLDWDAAMHLYQQKRSELEQVASESWSVPTSELSAHEERKANLETACREALDTALAIVGAAPTSRNAGALVQPAQGQLLLAYYEIESGWIGFAQTDSSVQSHPIGALNLEGSTPEQLSTQLLAPFKNLILEASEIVLMPWGETRKLDIHALPLDSKPLLAHSPTVYSLDLPKRTLPRASQTKTLVVSDPRGDLPVARQEGSLVSDIATAKRPTSVTHLGGNKATKAALTMRFADAEFLHYAGHGTFEGQRGWSSALPLADDSELNLSDILALEMPPRYVVLTGCETARSNTNVNLESVGIAQAFVLSGSEAVVAATRPIRDELGLAVAERLYGRVFDPDQGISKSLQQTLLEVAAADPRSDWASFRVLIPSLGQ